MASWKVNQKMRMKPSKNPKGRADAVENALMREIDRKNDPLYEPPSDWLVHGMKPRESRASQETKKGEWQTTLGDIAQIQIKAGPPEGLDAVKEHVALLEKMLYEHVNPKRYMRHGHMVDSKCAAYDWQIAKWDLPDSTRQFIVDFGCMTTDRLTGGRQMSMSTLRYATYKATYKLADQDKNRLTLARMLATATAEA